MDGKKRKKEQNVVTDETLSLNDKNYKVG